MLFPENHTMLQVLPPRPEPTSTRTSWCSRHERRSNGRLPVVALHLALHKEHFNKPRIYSPYRARTWQFTAVDAGCDFPRDHRHNRVCTTTTSRNPCTHCRILNSDLLPIGTGSSATRRWRHLRILREHRVETADPAAPPGRSEHDLIAETAEALTKSIGVQHSTRIKSEQSRRRPDRGPVRTLNQAVYALFGIGEDEQTYISTTPTEVQ